MKLELRKVEGKTRVIKKFVWFKKLKNKWRFFDFCHILQKCKSIEGYDPEKKEKTFRLEWIDQEWTSQQTLFLKCKCGNELTATGSFVSDTEDGIKYECTDCFRTSVWNFDLFPFPVEITDGEYPTPKEMRKEHCPACDHEFEGKA